MSFDKCNPASVAGDLLGSAALKDPNIDPSVLAQLDGDGMASMINRYTMDTADSLGDIPFSMAKPVWDEQRSYWNNFQNQFVVEYNGPDGGKLQQSTIGHLLSEAATPDSILGIDLIDALDDVSMDLYQRGIVNGAEYKKAINQVFDEIDLEDLTDGQQIYLEKYKADRLDGVLMKRTTNPVTGKVDNLSKGVVIGSPTVIFGNIVEPFMKGIPLYKQNFFKGLRNLIDERGASGLFDEIPEIKQQGLYGLDIGDISPERGFFEKYAGILDRPSKNLMYYVGKAADGTELGGRRAVQNVLFYPTFANTPLIYRNPESRAYVRLLSYSIGSMQMFRDVLYAAAKNPSPETITTAAGLLGMYGAVTGLPWYMKQQGEDVADVPVIGPVWKTIAGVSEVAIVNRIGIPVAIFNNAIMKPITKALKVFEGEELDSKDIWNAAAALTYLSAAPNGAVEGFIGNNQVRRAMSASIDTITGEKEAGEAFVGTFVPGWRED